ncbi:hypothetical protein [Campylobacter hyointestinalis]|uniref:hypothetical protein n=1 Tax=Campylobacter hyointestinalis TaxID=198 RepID=UPI000DCD10FD|nr:hypothetical protein [Campylobacter hyointestinalis]RAZ51904.1 hypothetical protein CHL10075_05120 [Campylobacter hyointestinalis subsp. lawsonii]
MVDFRLIASQISVEFEEDDGDKFELEFSSSRANIEEWLSLAKARGEAENSDPLTLKLLVQLYKKVDELSNLIKNEKSPQIPLKYYEITSLIGFEGFEFKNECLKPGKIYFARVSLPLFIKRSILLYFEALDTKTAKIIKVSTSDEKEWSMYVAQSERLEIRKQKRNG